MRHSQISLAVVDHYTVPHQTLPPKSLIATSFVDFNFTYLATYAGRHVTAISCDVIKNRLPIYINVRRDKNRRRNSPVSIIVTLVPLVLLTITITFFLPILPISVLIYSYLKCHNRRQNQVYSYILKAKYGTLQIFSGNISHFTCTELTHGLPRR